MEIIKIENLSFSYPTQEKKAINKVNLLIEEGDFIVVCGKSGCGKSTLLRHFKTPLTPHGKREGSIFYRGKSIEDVDGRTQASEIGFVLQDPETQIVTDKVWHELAFGLESLGYDNETIRLRVSEMASYFGIQEWFMKEVTELSGGQKQILNLAAIMAMNPKVLVLDEPTSQLDPIASAEFLETLKKINNDLGVTIIISEHRLEEVFPMADKVVVMEDGEVVSYDEPSLIGDVIPALLPIPMRVAIALGEKERLPVTVREGRRYLDSLFKGKKLRCKSLNKTYKKRENVLLEIKDVWFKYDKKGKDILKDLSFRIYDGEIFSIVGGNGTGKTTTLSIIGGLNKPYRGKVILKGKEINKYSSKELFHKNLSILPQNPKSMFVKSTVELDLEEALFYEDIDKLKLKEKVKQVSKIVGIEHLFNMHPYDLSGGEKQKVALAKILLLEPKVLLLDEPTKGLDNDYRFKLGGLLKKLNESGITIIMVTHDVEFAAMFSDRCGMFFDGNMTSINETNKFLRNNNFYTTSGNKMSRHLFDDAITCEDVVELCKLNLE